MAGKATFGHVEHLPSGKWRARYTGPDGIRRSRSFRTKTDARAWLASTSADVTRKAWKAPEHGRRTVGAYAADYLARSDLRDSTRVLYESSWRNHLCDHWQTVPVGDVTPARVRAWHTAAARTTRPTALAQAYRLLRAVLGVAVADDVLAANPCRLRTAGTPKPATPARALTMREVQDVAGAMPSRYRALVLVLGFGGLRFGEATALRRRDVALDGSTVSVKRAVRNYGGRWVEGPPKSDAGRRTVNLPGFVAFAVTEHLREHVADTGPDALVFGTSTGGYVARSNFGQTFGRAVRACGLPKTRVHWLRHTAATLAAQTGATAKELQSRIGHATANAALLYQHAAKERDSEIARAIDALAGTRPSPLEPTQSPRDLADAPLSSI